MTEQNTSKDEYLDVSSNMRVYTNMRFAQLTLFVAITAALLNVIIGDLGPSEPVGNVLKIGGLLSALVFWVMEERAADFFHYYKRRAIEMEKALGYSQYTNRPQRKVFTATNAVRMLFLAVGVYWLIWLCCPAWFS